VKTIDDTFSRFDTIPACDGQTDGRTDGQTSCDNTVRAMHQQSALCIAYALWATWPTDHCPQTLTPVQPPDNLYRNCLQQSLSG